MWFENKVTTNKEAFLQKVKLIAVKLGIDPNWLMFVMNSESGLNPAAYNPNGGASGLIQFMPDTGVGLGTTTAALRQMSNVDQLDYVYKYFLSISGKNGQHLRLVPGDILPGSPWERRQLCITDLETVGQGYRRCQPRG